VDGDPYPVPRALDLSAYRIVQEALTNTLKHAGRAQADVVLRYGADHIELRVTDTTTVVDATRIGQPAPTEAPASGHGLVGMRERVAMLGGELDAAPTAVGFAVRARLPVAPLTAPAGAATAAP
jgi:signal transduction histidine kinase